jgi:flagellar hook protein FlgE
VGESSFTLKSNAGGDVKNLSAWKLADISTSGLPEIVPNFIQASSASLASQTAATPIAINFGISSKSSSWTQSKGTIGSNASVIGNKVSNAGWLPNLGTPNVNALATQSFDTGGFSTLFQSQNGYTAGYLENVSVSQDGVLSGTFSNGQTLELYSLTLTTFTNEWGLRRDGSNLFSETINSGSALTGTANTGGKGSISSNSLESSNVDMGSQFVALIAAQRGFEANTKVITTADSLLSEVIAMKR